VKRFAFAALVLLFTGCGAVGTTTPRFPGIDEIRRRAEANPNDAEAQRWLAEGELTMEGGDTTRARAAIDHALALSPEDPDLLFMSAMENNLHGRLSLALDDVLHAIAAARTSTSPRAPFVAEAAASAISDYDGSVPGFGDRVRTAIAPIVDDPGHIGPAARALLGGLMVELAYRAGDVRRVSEVASTLGCATTYRVAGPFGPRALIDFDRALPPEEPGPLAASYDLGAARRTRETRTIETRGCALHLGNGPVGGAGTTYAETEVSVPSAGRYLLRLETPNAVEIFVDDASVARVDRRVEMAPRTSWHLLDLTSGTHRIMLKVASRHPNPLVLMSLTAADGSSATGGSAPSLTAYDPAMFAVDRPYDRLLAAAVDIARSDYVMAREVLAPATEGDDASVTMLTLASTVAMADPLRGQQLAGDDARRFLDVAHERDATAWYPTFQLLVLDALAGRVEQALPQLRAAAETYPEVPLFPVTIAQVMVRQGWTEQADQVIDGLLERNPDSCAALSGRLASLIQRGHEAEAGTLADTIVTRCDARSDARLTHLVRQRNWTDAASELSRIASLEPTSARFQILDTELTLARARGDHAAVQRLLGELETLMPQSLDVVMMQADIALGEGNREGARARFARAHVEEPESMADLFRIERAVLGDSPLERYRRDGAQVIREFEASGHHYEAPRVLVLDYTVTRLFPDGSILELTHNIIHVQSDEAAEEESQFSPPEGAQLLTLRTVKADGTHLEPDAISGLEHIELPNVAVGDYVEFEYLRVESPPQAFSGGVVGSRFFFRNYETPFESSSLTLVAPSSMQIVVDPRGQAPATEQSEDGDLRVYRWAVHQSEPFSREPSSVSPTEFFPSINWGYHASWADYVASLRDVLVDREVRDPAAERLVREIVGTDGASTAEQKATRIYEWVMDEIEEASGALFEQAATMVATRTGSRARVLLYLLHLAGIDADLALVRDFAGDSTESELPEDETYGSLLVRMAGTEGPIWIGTAQRGASFATLPPNLRGMDAMILNVAAERTRVAMPPLETDLRTVEVDATIDGDANGRFDVSETFRGAGAALWRTQLEGIPSANLESAFDEGYVSRILPGAHMTSLRITGREELDQPLVLHYEFEVESLGHVAHGRRMLPAIVPTQLTNAFARLASRDIEQVISPTLALDVSIRVHLPTGAEVSSLPDTEAELGGPHDATARYAAARSDDGFTLERHVRIPRMRVRPTEYGAFAGFCREADELEAREIGVALD
jgi:tetratricopeptide (TPR) repeat protein